MNSAVRNLEPKSLWNHFADINAVPRASKKEERIIEFIVNFGKSLNLETIVDKVGNVIVKKPATSGMETRKTVVLQGHLDMVHQKNADTDFDFGTQGIKMSVAQDWVTADGTTLGADNGLGVAAIMAILSSSDIAHPAIEALFTIDEETGMTGAMGLESGYLTGEILLNLDTEEDDEIVIGCAGGIDITATKTYSEQTTPLNTTAFTIAVTGLHGGHSGMDIHKGFGNANKIMNRLLFEGSNRFGLRVAQINGGGLRNAIPRESFAVVVVNTVSIADFTKEIAQRSDAISTELLSLEPTLSIKLEPATLPQKVMDLEVQEQLIRSIYAAHNGVYRMSLEVENLVETSNNIAHIEVKNGNLAIACLTRSSCETNKWDLANALKATFELAEFSVTSSGAYPGWQPNANSQIVHLIAAIYQKLNGNAPSISACHAGLECGILGKNYPNIDMVSFGPTILGAHSPDERASISSSQKFWKFLLKILKSTPEK